MKRTDNSYKEPGNPKQKIEKTKPFVIGIGGGIYHTGFEKPNMMNNHHETINYYPDPDQIFALAFLKEMANNIRLFMINEKINGF